MIISVLQLRGRSHVPLLLEHLVLFRQMSAGTLAQGAQTRLSTETVAITTNRLCHSSGKGENWLQEEASERLWWDNFSKFNDKTCEVERCSMSHVLVERCSASHVEFVAADFLWEEVSSLVNIYFLLPFVHRFKKKLDCTYLVC